MSDLTPKGFSRGQYVDRFLLRDKLYAEDAITMKGVAILNEFPAADVVEVVRCRECRFAPSGSDDSVEQGFGLKWPDDNWPYHTNPCPYRCEDEYYSHKPKPDFFCAAGKRKDGGQDE